MIKAKGKIDKGDLVYLDNDGFYAKALSDSPIMIKKLIFNWRFPFIHRVILTYTASEFQELENKLFDKWLDNKYFKAMPPLYIKETIKNRELINPGIVYDRHSRSINKVRQGIKGRG